MQGNEKTETSEEMSGGINSRRCCKRMTRRLFPLVELSVGGFQQRLCGPAVLWIDADANTDTEGWILPVVLQAGRDAFGNLLRHP